MPGLTSPQNFPYPLYTEANNGPAQIQALAEAIDDALVAVQASVALATERKRGRASSTAVQSIPNNAVTTMTYTVEDFDNDNIINLGVNNMIATATTAGIYAIVGGVRFVANATGTRHLSVGLNGVPESDAAIFAAASPTTQTRLTVSALVKLNAADTVFMSAFQTSGAALDTDIRLLAIARVSG